MRQVVDDIIARRPIRAGAFIVTLYGDVVVPRGGTIWIGNIIDLCAAVGISQTHVRTAVSRLVARERLVGERRGRLSFYRLAEAAHEEFERAADVIYASNGSADAQAWTFVVLDGLVEPGAAATALARENFVRLAPGLMVAPGDAMQLPQASADALVFRASPKTAGGAALKAFAAAHWPIAERQAAYGAFVAMFSPLASRLDTGDATGETCLLARLLLVHEYRRLALSDPRLPDEALPAKWTGHAARKLFSKLYAALSPAADAHVASNFVSKNGALAQSSAETSRRLEILQK